MEELELWIDEVGHRVVTSLRAATMTRRSNCSSHARSQFWERTKLVWIKFLFLNVQWERTSFRSKTFSRLQFT